LWNGLGELVSMMEHDLGCSWILFMNTVNHSSWGRLVLSFQGSEGMWTRESYMKLAKEKESRFWQVGRS